jgi:hypothetical protein
MPSLTIEDRKALLGPTFWTCSKCGTRPVKHYCRQCDAFYYSCPCYFLPEQEHAGHRVYRWTPDGIIADPNFDL